MLNHRFDRSLPTFTGYIVRSLVGLPTQSKIKLSVWRVYEQSASIVRHSIAITSIVAAFYITWQFRQELLVAYKGIVVVGILLALLPYKGIANLFSAMDTPELKSESDDRLGYLNQHLSISLFALNY